MQGYARILKPVTCILPVACPVADSAPERGDTLHLMQPAFRMLLFVRCPDDVASPAILGYLLHSEDFSLYSFGGHVVLLGTLDNAYE